MQPSPWKREWKWRVSKIKNILQSSWLFFHLNLKLDLFACRSSEVLHVDSVSVSSSGADFEAILEKERWLSDSIMSHSRLLPRFLLHLNVIIRMLIGIRRVEAPDTVYKFVLVLFFFVLCLLISLLLIRLAFIFIDGVKWISVASLGVLAGSSWISTKWAFVLGLSVELQIYPGDIAHWCASHVTSWWWWTRR